MKRHVKTAWLSMHSTLEKYVFYIITLCIKLSWFCHTNSGQLFGNCPRSRPLFLGKTSRDILSFCCCLKMAENSVSNHLALQDDNTTTSKQTQIIMSFEVQRLNNNEVE